MPPFGCSALVPPYRLHSHKNGQARLYLNQRVHSRRGNKGWFLKAEKTTTVVVEPSNRFRLAWLLIDLPYGSGVPAIHGVIRPDFHPEVPVPN